LLDADWIDSDACAPLALTMAVAKLLACASSVLVKVEATTP